MINTDVYFLKLLLLSPTANTVTFDIGLIMKI
jgi:hypothetical protein